MSTIHRFLASKPWLAICLALVGCPELRAQITLVASNSATNQIALGETYLQDFNSLASTGSGTWSNNVTLRGWYANFTHGQVSVGQMVASNAVGYTAVATGVNGTANTLASLGGSGSTNRSLGGTPGTHPDSGDSVNVVLRIKNSSGGVLKGLQVTYDTVASVTSRTNGVALAYRVFPSGTGAITNRFIETHRYTNSYNGATNESKRTEFGRIVTSTNGWTCVQKDVPQSKTNQIFDLRDLDVPPNDEVWIAWHIAQEDSGVTTLGIDNVKVGNFIVSRPGLPFIFQHPRQLAVQSGQGRDFKLDVGAAGSPAVSYQWRRNGTNLSGATASTLAFTNTSGSTHEGTYDVVVSNSVGSITSQPAKVNFYGRYTITTNSDVDFAALSSSQSNLRAATGGTLCDVYYPTNFLSSSYTNKVPVVVVIHGGGGNNGDKLDNREIQAAQEIAMRGWIGVAINYAMSSSSQQCWPYNVWDAKQAVRWLRQKAATGSTTYPFFKNIDTNRIGALGFSWGCNMGSMLAMTDASDDVGVSTTSLKVNPTTGNSYDNYSSAVKCSAVFYGACDLPNYHQMNQFLNYTAWDNRTLYRRASPVNYIRKEAAPMLIVHGSADDDVWQSQTETLYQQQRSVGAELEPYFVVPGGEHSFYLFETSRINAAFPSPVDVRPETLGFFEKYLVDDVRRPSIHFEPVSRIAAAGETVTLSVEARGTPTPTYQWRKNGTALAGQTSASLALTSVSSADTGWYDVVVSNSEGTVTSAGALVSISGVVTETAVSIISPPVSQTVSLGQTVSFSALAVGTLPITYQWRKGGTNLAGQTADTLTLSNLGIGDAGNYDVLCSNVANGVTNTVTSTAATLTIVPSQAIELAETSQAGNQITFSSGYSNSFAALPGTTGTLTNWGNESTIAGWSAYSKVTNPTTNFNAITTLVGAATNVSVNSGTWYSMDNSFGVCPTSGTGPGHLILRISNQSLTNLTGLSLVWDLRNGGSKAGLGSNAVSVSYLVVSNGTTLNPASPSSYPPSFYNTNAVAIDGWKLVTNLVDKSLPGPVNISNALTGLEVAPGDEIRIGWNISKAGGSNTISAIDNVRVLSMTSGAIGFDRAPQITAPPANQLVPLGAKVEFKATVEARPAPLYQWYKNGNPLTEQNSTKYGIPAVQVADAGTYTLVVSNYLGATNTAASLTVADTSRTNVAITSNGQSLALDLSTVSNAYSSWFNYGSIAGFSAYNITNTNAVPIAFTNYANWPGSFSTGTLVLANTTNGLAIGGVGSSAKSQLLVFRMANRSAGLVKGFRVNFTALALTNTSTNTNAPNLQGTLAASYKVLDATNASDTNDANFPPNFASTNTVVTNGWVPLTNILASSNVIVPAALTQTISDVNILPDQEIWLGFYLAKPNGDTHFIGVKDVSVDQFTVQSLDKPLPTISFSSPGALTYNQSVALSATSTGSNAPTYSIVSGGGSVSGNILTATSGTGSVLVRASFAETADYSANSADITVTLAKASQTITFALDPPSATVGDAPRTLIGTSDSTLPVNFASSSPAVASVSGNTLTFNTGGTTTITASQAGDANYAAATPISQVLTVTGPSVFTFSPGDLAIVACNATTDAFGVLALVDIPAGATFRVTDYGWLATGGFYTGSTEGVVSYTAPTGGVAKGTVLKWTTGAGAPWSQTTGFNFASGGDQLIIYQGPTPTGVPTADRLIYALQSKNGWSANATSSTTSAEPTVGGGGLTSGVTAVTVPGNTSGYYIGPTSGTKSYLLGEIAKLSNWVSGTGDYANSLWTGSFTPVTGSSFSSTFGGASATSDADGDGVPALLEYVLGGSTSGNDAAALPAAVMNGPNMEMTVVERIDDPAIAKVAEVSGDLGSWSSAGVTRTVSANQTGVPAGFQRVTYSVTPPSSSRSFMRMRVTLQP